MTFPIRFRLRRATAAVSQVRVRVAEKARAGNAPCTAETAECTCPDFCERDHGNE